MMTLVSNITITAEGVIIATAYQSLFSFSDIPEKKNRFDKMLNNYLLNAISLLSTKSINNRPFVGGFIFTAVIPNDISAVLEIAGG